MKVKSTLDKLSSIVMIFSGVACLIIALIEFAIGDTSNNTIYILIVAFGLLILEGQIYPDVKDVK